LLTTGCGEDGGDGGVLECFTAGEHARMKRRAQYQKVACSANGVPNRIDALQRFASFFRFSLLEAHWNIRLKPACASGFAPDFQPPDAQTTKPH
jgi:hypothetical protein